MSDHAVRFEVEGGYTGQARSLEVRPDGSADLEVSGRRSAGRLSGEQVTAVTTALEESGLFAPGRPAAAPAGSPPGADRQRYTLTYRGTTVVAHDGAVPAELEEAVRLLRQAVTALQR